MNPLQFSRETNAGAVVSQSIPKGDHGGYDEGFLWEMDLEENSIHHHNDDVASNLEGMRFDVDNDDSMVLL